MNNQPIQKREYREDGALYVHSIFYTIQGEGPFAGQPAIFLRLAGCNLMCPYCDTIYTGEAVRLMTVNDIVLQLEKLRTYKRTLLVITGGEPFRQNLRPLVLKLQDQMQRYRIQIETNGTLAPAALSEVIIVVSPKTPLINSELAFYADAFKYVLSHDNVSEEDGLPLNVLGFYNPKPVARPPTNFVGKIYVQPMDASQRSGLLVSEENKRNLNAAIASCMKFGYTLQLQLHKLIGME